MRMIENVATASKLITVLKAERVVQITTGLEIKTSLELLLKSRSIVVQINFTPKQRMASFMFTLWVTKNTYVEHKNEGIIY